MESSSDWSIPIAPPTDAELRQRGLGFYPPASPMGRYGDGSSPSPHGGVPQSPRPPPIVAAELDMHMDAYYKGLRRGRGISSEVAPPNDVVVAVDMAKSQHLLNQRMKGLNDRSIDGLEPQDSFRRPAPLNIPLTTSTADSTDYDKPPGNLPPKHQSLSLNYNGYSIGAAPDGMRRKYVDILNHSETANNNYIESSRNITSSSLGTKQQQKKKSPIKSSPRKKTPTAASDETHSSSRKHSSAPGQIQMSSQQLYSRKSYV